MAITRKKRKEEDKDRKREREKKRKGNLKKKVPPAVVHWEGTLNYSH